MYDTVMVDEAWFYVKRNCERFYLAPDEKVPVRKAKSKRHIQKVMFLAAVSRPYYCHRTKTWNDGKLGIFPFAEKVPAKHSSEKQSEKNTGNKM